MDKEMIVAWVMEHAEPTDIGWIGGRIIGLSMAQSLQDAIDKLKEGN